MKQSMTYAQNHIKADCNDGIGRLTIDNPERKNAVTAAMWRALRDAVHWLHADAGARVILLSGGGERDFCAGADISEFATVRRDRETARAYEDSNCRAFAALRDAPVPVIAAIRGVCYGGGLGLAAAADLRLSTPNAAFAVPAAKLGLAYPADAMQDLLLSLGSQTARRMLFTGSALPASHLLACGFLDALAEPDTLMQEAEALARSIAENAPLSIRAAKLALRAVEAGDPDRLRDAEVIGAQTFESADYAEGRLAFAEKRKGKFTGH